MPSTDQLQFEMQRRVILFNSGTTMPDNSVLGYEGNPNSATTATDGQTLLYNSPRGTSYIELVNGNLWYKQKTPNVWVNLTSGTGVYATLINLATTGSILDNKINSLSGYVNGISPVASLPNSIVYTTGDQLISGNKTFLNNIAVSGTGNFNNVKVSNIDKLFLSGIDIVITGNSSINVYNNIYISGNQVLTGSVQLGSYATVTNLFATGSTLDNKINSLSGYVNTISAGGSLPSTIVYITGNQNIGGNKTFTGIISFSGQQVNLIDTALNLSGVGDMTFNGTNINFINSPVFVSGTNLRVTGNVYANNLNNLVYTTGFQTIDGNKSFIGSPFQINNGTYLSVQSGGIYVQPDLLQNDFNFDFGYPYLTTRLSVGYNTGILKKSINSENGEREIKIYETGGFISSYSYGPYLRMGRSGILISESSENKVGIGTLFPIEKVHISGGNLRVDGNIYISGNQVLTGAGSFATIANLFATGSTLNNKINTLSGFLNDNVVYTTGNQTVLGQKTFSGTTTVIGHFAATSKSFLIDHPLDNNKKLQYASLEGPEHGVFVRGKTNENIINLPNYWSALVNENSISVNLTPINVYSNVYVIDYNNTRVITSGNNGNDYFYTIYGERKDIPKLIIEF